MAKAYICDPGLTHYTGHHSTWDANFASIFMQAGYQVTIYSHGNFEDTALEGAPVVRQFSKTIWHKDDQTDLLANWDDYFSYNKVMFQEMAYLHAGHHMDENNKFTRRGETMDADDIVIFPTILQYQLTGVVRWYYSLPKAQRPTIICYLMGPSGCLVNMGKKSVTVNSFDTARFYRLAFREVAKDPDSVHFFACGKVHAEQYSYLRGEAVESYPLLSTAIQPDRPLRQQARQQVLLHAGGARVEKGANLLPDIMAGLCPQHPDWHFIAQAGWVSEEAPEKPLYKALQKAGAAHDNLTYISTMLPPEDYCSLFNDSEIVLVPYHAGTYFNRSSGIVWEAIATANILVVPADCWLAREAERLGAAYVTFTDFTAASMIEAVGRAIKCPSLSREERISKANAFKQQNRLENLAEQIFKCWQPEEMRGQAGAT